MIKDINAITPEYMKHRLEEETEQYKQEIERLKEDNEYLNKTNIELSTEKNRLNNIINELEKCIDERINEAIKELLNLKDMIYEPETREINFDVQRKISSIIKILGSDEK